LRVVHVIERLSLGGPMYALAGAVRMASGASKHALVSLLPPDARAVAYARAAGIEVHPAPSADVLETLLADADIVQVHFWNNPAIHAFLASALPPLRLLVWCHVNGVHAPHVIPDFVFERADLVAASCALSLRTPAFLRADPQRVGLLFAHADLSRVGAPAPREHADCQVGYVGRVDFVKLHPAFVRLCAAVQATGVHFHACGGGSAHAELERQARAAGLADRFTARGHVAEIDPLMQSLDVFAYPLCEDTFATAELVLQEAMASGLPPVIFPHGGPIQLVEHRRNGLVAATEEEFTSALELLANSPAERARLGAAAAADARAGFGQPPLGEALHREYERLMRAPRRPRPPLPPVSGAGALLRSLDGRGDGDLRASQTDGVDALAAEARIGVSSANMHDVILHYRLHFPDDPWLRLWAGLLFRSQGRNALAAMEFKACLDRGVERPRVRGYFAEAIAP
jgi:glycosyltransferase involved in cell wall biosynthesis